MMTSCGHARGHLGFVKGWETGLVTGLVTGFCLLTFCTRFVVNPLGTSFLPRVGKKGW